MNEKIKFYLSDFEENTEPVLAETIASVQAAAGFEFPKDYVEAMLMFNGREGEIGKNGWLILFPIEELIEINRSCDLLMEQIPDYFLFGKDVADTGYAFHKTNLTIHSFGLMSDFETDPIEFCGNSFIEFLDFLYFS